MKANSVSPSGTNVLPIILGILAAALVFMVLTGRKVPLLTGERASLLALVAIGMVICANAGIGPMAAKHAWFHPFSIIAYVLGAVIVAIGLAAVFGKNIPPLTGYHQSFIAVTLISVLKLVLTVVHRLLL